MMLLILLLSVFAIFSVNIYPILGTHSTENSETNPAVQATASVPATSTADEAIINPSSQRFKPMKRIFYKTEEERLAARKRSKKKYVSKFSRKNIEIAEKTLTGEAYRSFHMQAQNYIEQRRKGYRRKNPIKVKEPILNSKSTVPSHVIESRREEEIRKANHAASFQIGSSTSKHKTQFSLPSSHQD